MLKRILYGLLVYIIGCVVVLISVSIYNNDTADNSFLRAIVFSVLYLAAIVSITKNRNT
ncbi:hypothetical protein BRIN106911_23895 [Brevibacillus invocatus]